MWGGEGQSQDSWVQSRLQGGGGAAGWSSSQSGQEQQLSATMDGNTPALRPGRSQDLRREGNGRRGGKGVGSKEPF